LPDSIGPQICQADDREAEQDDAARTSGSVTKLERERIINIPVAIICLTNMMLLNSPPLP